MELGDFDFCFAVVVRMTDYNCEKNIVRNADKISNILLELVHQRFDDCAVKPIGFELVDSSVDGITGIFENVRFVDDELDGGGG